MKQIWKSLLLSGLWLTLGTNSHAASEKIELTKVGTWTNVVNFSINRAENHMILSLLETDGRILIYETTHDGYSWSPLEPISSINNLSGSAGKAGGVCMTDNEMRIYFHADFSNGVGGYDIYYVDRLPQGWGEPQLVRDVCSTDDELFPTITPGEQTMYFLKHQVVGDYKSEKKEGDKLSIYYTKCDAKGKWKKPEPVNIALNKGYVQDVNVAADASTVYYSSREERKEPSLINFTRIDATGSWVLPAPIFDDESGFDYMSPNFAGNRLYMIRSNTKKRERVGTIYYMTMPAANSIQPIVEEKGNIVTLETHKPVQANVTVYNPTTLKTIGSYESDQWTGEYFLTNPGNAEYIIDVRNPGYSFASYLVDYRKSGMQQLPSTIELFDTIRLAVDVYDSEIFRPLDSKVIAVRTSDKSIFRSTKVFDGRYQFSLPLGSDYNIIATTTNFVENKFLFKLEGDIIFSYFNRELPLDPLKRDIKIRIVDSETKEPINADVVFDNQSREELLTVSQSSMTAGTYNIKLRSSDLYDMTVSGAQGYAFHNSMVDMSKLERDILEIELVELRKNVAIQLNNINFATASAEIMVESYPELDRVVKLLLENPQLKIELAAHTDNVGNARYNLLLSDRRAQSVVDYLIENGVPMSSLVPKGYGLTKPLVPNTSEANRAKNRRVEFVILDVEE